VPDNAGWFKIQIDRNNNQILAIHYSPGIEDPVTIVKGTKAIDIYQTIIRNKLITNLEHAAYLGKELQKAEIALKLYRSYQQDEPLFN
jgi:dihydropteroate synthase